MNEISIPPGLQWQPRGTQSNGCRPWPAEPEVEGPARGFIQISGTCAVRGTMGKSLEEMGTVFDVVEGQRDGADISPPAYRVRLLGGHCMTT